MNTNTFIALDFETMTAEHTSVCAAGIVQVVNGIVRMQYYTLVSPVKDDRTILNTFVHGITPEMTEGAPNFVFVHELLKNLTADGTPIVCHNKEFDLSCIKALEEYYELERIDTSNSICTLELTGLKLKMACSKYGIKMGQHHNALADALACAYVYLEYQGIAHLPEKPARPSNGSDVGKRFEYKKIDKQTLSIPNEDEIENKDTPFYRCNCVITGKFEQYPKREELAKTLRSLGADINTGISGATTIVVMGNGAGRSKMQEIEIRNDKGQGIRIIREEELIRLLKSAGIL